MRENYQPFNIGSRFTVVPPGNTSSVSGRINLAMERGAFGSGEHETTRSCIELLESVPPADQLKILDLGSGTGILSIAALLSNREATATCLDIDPVAVASCRRNCSLNQLDHRVKHSCGTLDQLDERNFDLVLANIYGDILLEIAADLVDRTAAGGYLLLSGILWEYNYDVKKRYRTLGCSLVRSLLLEEFCTLLLKRD